MVMTVAAWKRLSGRLQRPTSVRSVIVWHLPSTEPKFLLARGTKRKASELSFSAAEVEKLAAEAEAEAAARIERETAEAVKAKLPDFWLPSLTPTHDDAQAASIRLKDVKAVPSCRGGKDVHEISCVYTLLCKRLTVHQLSLRLKKLIPVEFSYPTDLPPDVRNAADRRDAICPSCKKGFSNSTKMFCKLCIHSCTKVRMNSSACSDDFMLSCRL